RDARVDLRSARGSPATRPTSPVSRLVLEREAAGEVEHVGFAIPREPTHLVGVVHDALVAGLVVRVVASAVAQPEVVAELVHERPRLLARRASSVGEVAEGEEEVRTTNSARDAARTRTLGIVPVMVVGEERVVEDAPPSAGDEAMRAILDAEGRPPVVRATRERPEVVLPGNRTRPAELAPGAATGERALGPRVDVERDADGARRRSVGGACKGVDDQLQGDGVGTLIVRRVGHPV